MIALKINNINKTIKSYKILKDIHLELEAGGIYGFVGRNGSGKSMLFKTIVGIVKPDTGFIKVFDETITAGKFSEHIGLLLDKPGFLPQYSGFDNLKMLASIRNIITHEEIKHIIQIVGLDPNDQRPVKKYSLGMTQKLGIAQAIMEKPKLLILDEPMNGLDEESVLMMRQLLKELKVKGITVLLSSHHAEDIKVLCDAVYQMDNGILRPIS